MNPKTWYWNKQLVPALNDTFAYLTWQFAIVNKFTVGGVALKMINIYDDPLLILVESSAIVVGVSSIAVRDGAIADLLSGSSSHAIFTPGEKILSRYPVTSEGVSISVSAIFDGEPINDVRSILKPELPTFTASSIINRLGGWGENQNLGFSKWTVLLDQLSGDVFYVERPSESPSIAELITDNGGSLIVALNAL